MNTLIWIIVACLLIIFVTKNKKQLWILVYLAVGTVIGLLVALYYSHHNSKKENRNA